MAKFEIKEINIDNFYEMHNFNKNLYSGLNIICGNNEIGKSTIMEFIKNILIKKSDAKGYIKCSLGGNDFQLRAEKNKQKENLNYININPHEYQAGFVINLDDLMFAKKTKAKDLLDTIQDLSGIAINDKEKEYYDYIYEAKKQKFILTSTNQPSVNFKKQFEKLKTLDLKIQELKSKEEEYNNICLLIDDTIKNIQILSQKKLCRELFDKKNQISQTINNIKINQALLDQKTEFEKIREQFGAINFIKQNEENLYNELKTKENEKNDLIKKINKLISNPQQDLSNIALTTDDLKQSQYLTDKKNEIRLTQNALEKELETINNHIKELEFQVQTLENQIQIIGIDNYEEYKKDQLLLENYKNEFSDLLNKEMNKPNNKTISWYKNVHFMIFSAILFLCIALELSYWNTNLRYPLFVLGLISLSGITTTFMESIEHKRDIDLYNYNSALENIHTEMLKICSKYGFQTENDNNFILKNGAIIQTMKEKITDYKFVQNNLLKERINLEKEKKSKEDKKTTLALLKEKQTKYKLEEQTFLTKTAISTIEDFSEFYACINQYKELTKNISEIKKNLDNLNNDTLEFINKLNIFSEKTGLSNISDLNKYDYQKINSIILDIREQLDENISNNKLISELNIETDKINSDLAQYSDEYIDEIKNTNIELIEEELKNEEENKIRLFKIKSDLEQVSDLINIKNEKSSELNNLRTSLNKLIQKEMVYKIIKKSKEKYNQTRPNLINAKKYFSYITNGKYNDIDLETMIIKGENTSEKDWDILSRGTKEQLYLALKLGYANNYSKDIDGNENGIPNLPLIIDDAFVNFDINRTISVLKSLEEFSKDNQVLYFTCHTNMTKDILKSQNIEYNLIEL